MTEAQKILSLIESVDPNDTAALDEIDAEVALYTGNLRTGDFLGNGAYAIIAPTFTRSRDALKEIRPDGYKWVSGMIDSRNGFKFFFHLEQKLDVMVKFDAESSTEELSELSAIIQAIEYERSQK